MSCKCHNCKAQFKMDLLIPGYIWKKIYTEDISKAKTGGGLLCPSCIIKRVENIMGYCSFYLKENNTPKVPGKTYR